MRASPTLHEVYFHRVIRCPRKAIREFSRFVRGGLNLKHFLRLLGKWHTDPACIMGNIWLPAIPPQVSFSLAQCYLGAVAMVRHSAVNFFSDLRMLLTGLVYTRYWYRWSSDFLRFRCRNPDRAFPEQHTAYSRWNIRLLSYVCRSSNLQPFGMNAPRASSFHLVFHSNILSRNYYKC